MLALPLVGDKSPAYWLRSAADISRTCASCWHRNPYDAIGRAVGRQASLDPERWPLSIKMVLGNRRNV